MSWPCVPNLPQPLVVGPLLSTADHMPPHELTYLEPPPAAAACRLPPMWALCLSHSRLLGSATTAPGAPTHMPAPALGLDPNHGVAAFLEIATAGAPASHRYRRPTIDGHTRASTWPTAVEPALELLIAPAGACIRTTWGQSRLAPTARDPDWECSGSELDDYTVMTTKHLMDLMFRAGGGTGRRKPLQWDPFNVWGWACRALACVRPPPTLVSGEAEAPAAAVGRH